MEKNQTEKKVFKHQHYADSSFDEITKWLKSQIYNEDGTIKTHQLYFVIKIIKENE